MAHNGSPSESGSLQEQKARSESPATLAPPAVTALKQDAGVDSSHRVQMERTFSEDIQEGTRDLKEAAEQTKNIILDLSLDGNIRWVSPSWTDVIGTNLAAVRNNPISRFIEDNSDAFDKAISVLKHDDSKSQFVKFSIKVGPDSDIQPLLPDDQREHNEQMEPHERQIIQLEGQGIMVYDRVSGGESHVSSLNGFKMIAY